MPEELFPDKYSWDTSSIIQARMRDYPTDTFPNVWSHIEELIANGRLRAVELVKDELRNKEDDASRWAEAQEDLFVQTDEDIQLRVRSILKQHPRLVNPNRPTGNADPFVIALAQQMPGAVITGETKPGPGHIPYACRELRIPFGTLLALFRSEGWRF